MMFYKTKQPFIRNTLNIFSCFLLTSTGYFLWLYNLRSIIGNEMSDIMTTVVGYLLQAVGILIYSQVRKRETFSPKGLFLACVILYLLFLVPSAISHTVAGALAFGLINSLLCGIIAGHYLCRLTQELEKNSTATAFGIGYALATFSSWLMSKTAEKYFVNISFVVCIALCVIIAALNSKTENSQYPNEREMSLEVNKTLSLFAVLVILFSLVNNIGFYFQSADAGVQGIEFSRLFYAAGIVFAGIISDKNRKYGSVCAMASLAFPFITLALRGETLPLTIFWALSYFAFGFYSVFRVVIFSDMAKERDLICLSGFGLMLGRAGDAAGAGLNIALKSNRIILVILAAVLFALSVFLFFVFYQRMYIPASARQKTQREIFNAFSAKHDLSQREREVLRLLIDEKTNKEIAEQLYVSESTVKFHIHNLLKKTGAKNRLELINAYCESAQS